MAKQKSLRTVLKNKLYNLLEYKALTENERDKIKLALVYISEFASECLSVEDVVRYNDSAVVKATELFAENTSIDVDTMVQFYNNGDN